MFEHEDTTNDSAPSPSGGYRGAESDRASSNAGVGAPDAGNGGNGSWQDQGRGSNVTDARPQSPYDAGAAIREQAAINQGRGSNVTSQNPYNPAESVKYGMAPTVQPQVAPVSLPTFAQYQMNPISVGMPSILSAIQPPPMTVQPTTEAINPMGVMIPDMGVKLNKYDISPMMGQETGPQRRGVPMSAVRDNFEYQNRDVINNFLNKTATAESSNNPNAQSTQSSAGGLYQFIDKTWLDTVQKNRPDLFNTHTEKEILDMKYDPILSTEMARALAVDNAMALKANNLPITERNLYLEHFLGTGGAIKALTSDPTTPMSDIVSEGAVKANARVLGGDKTVADVLNWTGSQMGRSTYASNKGLVNEAGSTSPDVFQGSPASYLRPEVNADGFAVPGGQQTAAQAASSSPKDFGAWLSGLFDTNARVKELEAQGRTSTYPGEDASDVKQWYADQFAGGDVSKVQSRITNFGDGPVVDYYVKDLGMALLEGFASPFKAVGNMLNPPSGKADTAANTSAAKVASEDPNNFGAWLSGIFTGSGISSLPQGSSVRDKRFSDIFSQMEPTRGYGPNGDMTLQEYRQAYGR